jgi:hypothetical protein
MAALAVGIAAVAAVLSYRLLEGWTGASWLPAGLRAAAWGAVTLLLVNASCPAVRPSVRPTVLLDGSLSMQAAGGRWSEALALARRAGDVRLIGPAPGDTTPSAGRTRLAAAIAGARSAGRPVIVVTDGEVEDAGEIPPDVLAATTVRVLPRRDTSDVALTRVEGTTRLTRSDSLRIEVEAVSVGGRPSAAAPAEMELRPSHLTLEAREGDRVWLRGAIDLAAAGRGHTVLAGPLPDVPAGAHVLTVRVTNAADAEPRDDARLLVVTVVPTPGVVLLASPPGWESRFLLDALRDVSALPARGYLETEPGRWRRAGDMRPVSAPEVADAARRADLLVTIGSPGDAARHSRARGLWSWVTPQDTPGTDGDWYVSFGPASPISGAAAGLAVDSFPPGTAVAELVPGPRDWVGLTAQAARRGTPRPVLVGGDSAGVRRVRTGIDGLWRWAFRGGSSEQGYRSLVAATVSWLLGAADSATGLARLQHDVVQRGRPAVFEWSGPGAPVPVALELTGPGAVLRDTLVFDGAGHAEVLLPPGVWRYKLAGGGAGTLAVEEYSDEWVPSARTLAAQETAAGPEPLRMPLRGWLPLFGIAVAAFAGEWLARRRMGLR